MEGFYGAKIGAKMKMKVMIDMNERGFIEVDVKSNIKTFMKSSVKF